MKLNQLLKGVSRSFYLSLRFLPHSLRAPMGLAFLACKAADTIADTKIVPRALRLEYLEEFRSHFANGTNLGAATPPLQKQDDVYEQELLRAIPQIIAALDDLPAGDRELIGRLVQELTQGMIFDLKRFPGENAASLSCLRTDEELDDYIYHVAGCVGVFWTRILREHFDFAQAWNRKSMKQIGKNFGKGLQMVNILRDLPRDLQQGRCYLPENSLAARGLGAHHLLDPKILPHLKPYLEQLLAKTRELLANGDVYAAAHPRYAIRLRWAVLLPMQLGYQTLNLLEASDRWLDPQTHIKVTRRRVYTTMLTSLVKSFGPQARDQKLRQAELF